MSIALSPQEQAAGYETISQKWGFLLSLNLLSGGDILKEEKILTLPVSQVYTKLQVLNNLSATDKAHRNLLNR